MVGVERLKGTAKGIDLAAFIMEQRVSVASGGILLARRGGGGWGGCSLTQARSVGQNESTFDCQLST